MSKTLRIATGRIDGLNKPPYYFEHRCYYAWDISFKDSSTIFYNNLPWIKVGDTWHAGIRVCNRLKRRFRKANIFTGSKVDIIYEDDGTVLAFGRLGQNIWFDVTDNYQKKTWKELKLHTDSLLVF